MNPLPILHEPRLGQLPILTQLLMKYEEKRLVDIMLLLMVIFLWIICEITESVFAVL
jgi:hypothetical protein